MKDTLSLFASLIVIAFFLAAPNPLRAQESDSESGSTTGPSTNHNGGGITLDPHQALPPGHPSIDSDRTDSAPDASTPGQGSGSTAAQNDPAQIPTPVNRASHLIGMTVKNPQDQTLGKIRDVVFDLKTGRVSYVVLAKAGRNRGAGSDLAIPLSAFTPSSDRQNLVLNADRTRIQNSTGFSGNNLPAMNNPAFGAQAEPVRREILIVPVPMSPDHGDSHRPDKPSPDSDQSPKMENP